MYNLTSTNNVSTKHLLVAEPSLEEEKKKIAKNEHLAGWLLCIMSRGIAMRLARDSQAAHDFFKGKMLRKPKENGNLWGSAVSSLKEKFLSLPKLNLLITILCRLSLYKFCDFNSLHFVSL